MRQNSAQKTKGLMVLEFTLLSFSIGIPLILGLFMFLVHVYLDNAAIADSFLSARAELYSNPGVDCSVAKFWPQKTNLFEVQKTCSGNGQVSLNVHFFPVSISKERSKFSFKKSIDLRTGGAP